MFIVRTFLKSHISKEDLRIEMLILLFLKMYSCTYYSYYKTFLYCMLSTLLCYVYQVDPSHDEHVKFLDTINTSVETIKHKLFKINQELEGIEKVN